MTRLKHVLGDGALWIALVLVFGLVATVRIVAQDSPTCSYSYSSWEECRSDGKQVRTVQSADPEGCSGEPDIERSCTYTSPSCSYTYSSWGTCQSNGVQTRTVQSANPSGCAGTPEVSRSCTYSPPTCAYTYSSWGACQSNGTMTRSVLTATPSGCTGTPQTSQTCTYSGGGSTTCAFTYNAWNACQPNNMRTRTVATATPSGCTGTPVLSESCTYSAGGAPTCNFTYNSWGTCQSNNIRTRTVATATPAGCVGTPVLSESCTSSSGGGSTVCAFTYNDWGICQSSGIQTRSVVSATPAGCTGTPETSRTCTSSGGSTSSPTCAFTYSSWGACQSNGTMTRSVLTAMPSGCTGTPQTSQTCTYSGGGSTTCAFTYNAWNACQPNNMRTRTVATATPSGCTGTPVLSETCTYSGGTATTPTCTFTYNSWSDCKSNGSQTRSVATATPSGCVGNPETSRSCTYTSSDGTTTTASSCAFTYSAWGNCSASGIQTRAVLSYLPSGCVGSPSVSQSCAASTATSTLPVCTYTYSSWGICQSNNFQTRGVISQTPSNCSGNPEVMRSCVAATSSTSSGGASSTTSSTLPVCAYTYSPWGVCQSNGTQTRSALSKTPSNCAGDPHVSQFCTYVAGVNGNTTTASLCAFTYTPWSSCSSAGLETRAVISRTPYNCVGTPELSRACSSSNGVSAPSCVFTYSPWISCESTGMEMRSMLSKAPSVCAGTPELSRVCTYTPTALTSTSTGSASATAGNFAFSDIGMNGEFSGMSRVKGVVSGASGVEYFLLNPSSNDISSLGVAEQTRENLWERSFDSTVFPNGPFYLMARVRTTSGTRESSRMKIVIANRAATLSTTSTETSPASTGSDAGTTPSTASAPATVSVAELKDFRGTTTGKWQKLYFGSDRCEREDFCGADADPDGDDLANKDEFRYNTNPLAMDTDGDDFSDGREVRDGFNPLLASRGDKNDQMTYESPKETGTVEKELFAVGNVETIPSESDAEEKNLKLSGTGPANTLLNVFVYSELPTILTVKTDADGNWSYTLEKSLDDGEHQVYVAVTDHTGKIAAKSEPLAFVKTAQAATVIPPAEAQVLENSISPVEKRKVSDMTLLGIVAVFALLTALLLIGYLIRRKKMRAQNGEMAEAPSGNDAPNILPREDEKGE